MLNAQCSAMKQLHCIDDALSQTFLKPMKLTTLLAINIQMDLHLTSVNEPNYIIVDIINGYLSCDRTRYCSQSEPSIVFNNQQN